VDRIFDHPLEAVLDPELSSSEPLSVQEGENWPYTTEFYVRIFKCFLFKADNLKYFMTEHIRLVNEQQTSGDIPNASIPIMLYTH
jgi:hypothetical protein